MMRMLIAGGKLQGAEIAFLAREAGWHTTLVDRRADALASSLCDEAICADLSQVDDAFLSRFDLVFPAIERGETLIGLKRACVSAGVPYAFDEGAYRLSSSKRATYGFLSDLGLRVPQPIEGAPPSPGGFIVKPDMGSGSVGVRRFAERDRALSFLEGRPSYIGQAFLEGAVLSAEVVCNRGVATPHCITEVVVGDDFDCHRIVAPAPIDSGTRRTVMEAASEIGRALYMRGIFDIELVMHDGEPHILEIDARMPSQTPIAVYHATGVNLVEETARVFTERLPASSRASLPAPGSAVLQHIEVKDGKVRLIGEGELAGASPLNRRDGAFGADVALIGTGKDHGSTVATLVVASRSADGAVKRMQAVLEEVTERCGPHDIAHREEPGRRASQNAAAGIALP